MHTFPASLVSVLVRMGASFDGSRWQIHDDTGQSETVAFVCPRPDGSSRWGFSLALADWQESTEISIIDREATILATVPVV